MKKFIFLIALLALVSCRSNKPTSSGVSKSVVKESARDTVMYTRPDSASLVALLRCDSLGNAYLAEITQLKTGRSTRPEVKVKDNFVFVDCIVDSMAIYLAKYKVFNSETDTSSTIVTMYPDKPKGKLEAFVDNLLIILVGIALGIGIMLFMLKMIWK